MIVQTAFPNHPLFQALRAHDYEIWAQTLLAERQMAGFPPFVYQVLLSAESKQESDAHNFLKQARSAAQELHMPVEVYGVVPAAMPKRANHHRAQLLVQSDNRKIAARISARMEAGVRCVTRAKAALVAGYRPDGILRRLIRPT